RPRGEARDLSLAALGQRTRGPLDSLKPPVWWLVVSRADDVAAPDLALDVGAPRLLREDVRVTRGLRPGRDRCRGVAIAADVDQHRPAVLHEIGEGGCEVRRALDAHAPHAERGGKAGPVVGGQL